MKIKFEADCGGIQRPKSLPKKEDGNKKVPSTNKETKDDNTLDNLHFVDTICGGIQPLPDFREELEGKNHDH